MVARISTNSAISVVNAMVDSFDEGAGANAKLQIWSGERPTAIDDATTTQVLLVEYDLPNPSFGTATASAIGATAVAEEITTVDALATGEAAWFRVLDTDGDIQMDGTVTAATGDGDLKISSTAITAAVKVAVVSWSVSIAKGE